MANGDAGGNGVGHLEFLVRMWKATLKTLEILAARFSDLSPRQGFLFLGVVTIILYSLGVVIGIVWDSRGIGKSLTDTYPWVLIALIIVIGFFTTRLPGDDKRLRSGQRQRFKVIDPQPLS